MKHSADRLAHESILSNAREILRFTAPLVAASVITALNGFTDSFFLARFSDAAMRAALPANTFAGFVTTIVVVAVGYCGTMLARALGGGSRARAVAIAANGLLLAAVSSALFAAAIPLSRVVLGLFGHADGIARLEETLAAIMLAGGPLAAAAAVCAGFFSGQGLTRTVWRVTFLGIAVKILLTPLLVFGSGPLPEMGIAGSGVSFIAAQLVVCTTYAVAACRNPLARLAFRRPRLLRIRPGILGNILGSGLPLSASMVVGYGSFFALVSLVGRLDPASVAASTAVFAINCPFNAVITGMSEGVEIICGRRHGERNVDAVVRTTKVACLLSSGMSLLYVVALTLAGRTALGWFLPSGETLDEARYFAVGIGVVAMLAFRIAFEFVQHVLEAAMRGMGNTSGVFISTVATSVGAWIPGCVVSTLFFPSAVAFWATMVAAALLGCICDLALLSRSVRHYAKLSVCRV